MQPTVFIERSGMDRLLETKYFFFQPFDLLSWIWRLPVRPVAQKILQLHLHNAATRKGRGEHYDSDLSVSLMADLLGVSIDAINKGHQQLTDEHLITRITRHSSDGRQLPSLTRLQMPADEYLKLFSAPARNKPPTITAPPSVPDTVAEGQQATEDTPTESAPATEIPEDTNAMEKAQQAIGHADTLIAEAKAHEAEAASKVSDLYQQNASAPIDDFLSKIEVLSMAASQATREVDVVIRHKERCIAERENLSKLNGFAKAAESTKSNILLPTPRQRLNEHQTRYLSNRLALIRGISNPTAVLRELIFHLTDGVYGRMAFRKAANITTALVKTGRWRTPKGYTGVIAA